MATQPQKALGNVIAGEDDSAFINEQIEWLKAHREELSASWSDIGQWTGIPSGTISQLCGPKGYPGNRRRYADQIAVYRQTVAAQADISVDLPEKPGYFETPSSLAITQFLQWAQRGRLVMIVTGAGIGKSQTAENFQISNAGVFIATMTPSTSGIMPMQQRVLKSLGEKHSVGSPAALSEMICEVLRKRKHGLLIIDEAQHLSIKALEEIRSWYDETGCGIALMGNERVQQSIDGVSRAADFAQLFSRIGLRLVRTTATPGDADALAAAWKISDQAMIEFLRGIVARPGALRGATFALEVAHMLAVAQGTGVTLLHLKKAWAQLSNSKVLA